MDSLAHYTHISRIKSHAQKKRSRNRERFFKFYDDQDFITNQSFIDHLQKRQAAYLDFAFQTYLYYDF